MKSKCKIEGCDDASLSKGMCQLHYKRTVVGTDVNRPRVVRYKSTECRAEGCEEKRHSKGYCSKHYFRVSKYNDPTVTHRFFWKDDTEKYLWHNAKARAEKLKIPFNIPKGYLKVPDTCPVLGMKLVKGRKTGKGFKDNSPSVDRIIPEKGYVIGNVHVISFMANRLKSNATPDQLMKVATYFNNLEKA